MVQATVCTTPVIPSCGGKTIKVIQYVEDQFSDSCISEKVAKCGGEVNSLIKKCVTLIIARVVSQEMRSLFLIRFLLLSHFI